MQQDQTDDSTALKVVAQAIHTRQMIAATYNGAMVELCPHELFVRHQSVYLRALNPNKSRRHDEEASLGNFNIAGLSDITLSGRPFKPLPSFDGVASRSDELTIVSVVDVTA